MVEEEHSTMLAIAGMGETRIAITEKMIDNFFIKTLVPARL